MHLIHPRSPGNARRRLTALVMAGATALLVVAGCGADKEATPASSPAPTGPARMSPVPKNASYNAADVVFTQDLLANLRQATELAKLAKTRASNPELKKLAVKADQDRQAGILLTETWLEKMKQPMPPGTPPAGQHGAAVVKPEDQAKLSAASGEAFDRLFIQLMIKLNEAAEVLVNGEQWSGINGPLISLSHKVSDDTKAELTKLRQLT